jgi:hypothetical protein
MGTSARACGIAVAVIAVGLVSSGCGSESTIELSPSVTSSASSASSSEPPTSAQASGPNETIADYLKKNGITQTPISKGDAASPEINLPIPAGWEDADATKPPGAYSSIRATADAAPAGNPPAIVATVSKLSDKADPAAVLEYASGELKNLPRFEGGKGEKDELDGFDAFRIGGTYVKDGTKLFVAQKTVAIPGPNGLFVLQLNAKGPEDKTDVLLDAMDAIDQQTTITA